MTKLDPRKCKCATGICHLCREDAEWKKATSKLDPKWEKKATEVYVGRFGLKRPKDEWFIKAIMLALQSVADEVREECAKVAESLASFSQPKTVAKAIRYQCRSPKPSAIKGKRKLVCPYPPGCSNPSKCWDVDCKPKRKGRKNG